MSRIKKRIPRPLLVVSLVLATMLAAGLGFHQATANANSTNLNVQTVNQTGQSFGVAWYTTRATSGGSIDYGPTCATATHSVAEQPGNGYGHLVSVPGGLAPNTTYYYKIVSSGTVDSNGGTCYTAKTLPAQTLPPTPATIYGIFETNNCSTPVAGGLVEVSLDQGSSGSSSQTLATIASSTGTWAIPFGVAAMSDGTYESPAAGDTIEIHGIGPNGKTGEKDLAYNGKAQLIGPKTVCTFAYN
ncbi:MAG TPA: fibronectin type III domain-containing protein [Chloroflexota bacterium]|nr:fibronectin type III domain-containing protein [Chloroflexota bacterium]